LEHTSPLKDHPVKNKIVEEKIALMMRHRIIEEANSPWWYRQRRKMPAFSEASGGSQISGVQ
jgi:hypothetical protein